MEEIEIKKKLKPIEFTIYRDKNNSGEIIGKTESGKICKLPFYAKEELKPGDIGEELTGDIGEGLIRIDRGNYFELFCVSKVEREKI